MSGSTYTTRLGHVRLQVSDLDRAIDFYTRRLKLTVSERSGDQYVFLTSGEPHHLLALFAAEMHLRERAASEIDLDHLAFEVPDKVSFARAYEELTGAGIPLATSDNGIGWSMYFHDPDGNALEIFCDTRREPDGQALWEGTRRPLTADRIMAVLDSPGAGSLT